jgi:TRAP-type uncharacterized transport system fused permease subunit
MYASFLVTGIAYTQYRLLALLPALICCLAYCGVYKFTRRYAIQTSRRDTVRPDEREASVRDHAMARSYLVVSFLFLLFTGLMGQRVQFTDGEWNYIFWAVMLITSTLPQALITWNEPDLQKSDPLT